MSTSTARRKPPVPTVPILRRQRRGDHPRTRRLRPGQAGGAPEAATAARAPVVDAFPHTNRPLPWLLAGFMAVVFLVPIDSTVLKIHLPVDSHIDRFCVIVLVAAWWWFRGDQRAFMRTKRSKVFVTAICIFLGLAVASDLFDAHRLINLGEMTLPLKQFALYLSWIAVGWFALTALRFEDMRGMSTWLIILGTTTASGMILERQTGYNIFYIWAGKILSPIASVATSPTVISYAFGSDGRVSVLGPTKHPLAATTLLVMIAPFALVRALDAVKRRDKLGYALAGALMLMAAMATDRKSAFVIPVAVFLYLIFYRPRQIMRYAPLWLPVLAILVHFAAPGSIGHILNVNGDVSSGSTTHRLGDYSGIAADVDAHPILGRGFGSINADQASMFRINDDQYLDQLWAVGVAGLLAYAWMLFSPLVTARRAIKGPDKKIAGIALATSASCLAFFISNVLFDALSYPQTPYVFFVVAAMTVIVSAGPAGNVEPLTPVRRIIQGPMAVLPARRRRAGRVAAG